MTSTELRNKIAKCHTELTKVALLLVKVSYGYTVGNKQFKDILDIAERERVKRGVFTPADIMEGK